MNKSLLLLFIVPLRLTCMELPTEDFSMRPLGTMPPILQPVTHHPYERGIQDIIEWQEEAGNYREAFEYLELLVSYYNAMWSMINKPQRGELVYIPALKELAIKTKQNLFKIMNLHLEKLSKETAQDSHQNLQFFMALLEKAFTIFQNPDEREKALFYSLASSAINEGIAIYHKIILDNGLDVNDKRSVLQSLCQKLKKLAHLFHIGRLQSGKESCIYLIEAIVKMQERLHDEPLIHIHRIFSERA